VLLVRTTDYTATNGTSVVLALAATLNDTLVVVAYGAFNVANTYTQAEADARYPLNTSSFFAGKNKVINGNFGIWQRGTSFTIASGSAYTADRFQVSSGSGGTVAATRQTFTAGQTDVPNAIYFLQLAYSVSGTDAVLIDHRVEDVNTFAGQSVTFSFYAKVSSGTKSITPRFVQDFGSGGSATVVTNLTAQTLTTSWQRFTITSTVPSVSGKTIGTSSYLRLDLLASPSGTLTYSLANVQLEAGSTATAFQTATGTIQGELAACQRYYYRNVSNAAYGNLATTGYCNATTTGIMGTQFPVQMRIAPTAIETTGTLSNYALINASGSVIAATAITYDSNTNAQIGAFTVTTAASMTLGQGTQLRANNSTTAYIGWSAEL
jgi:hypothetical protein